MRREASQPRPRVIELGLENLADNLEGHALLADLFREGWEVVTTPMIQRDDEVWVLRLALRPPRPPQQVRVGWLQLAAASLLVGTTAGVVGAGVSSLLALLV